MHYPLERHSDKHCAPWFRGRRGGGGCQREREIYRGGGGGDEKMSKSEKEGRWDGVSVGRDGMSKRAREIGMGGGMGFLWREMEC